MGNAASSGRFPHMAEKRRSWRPNSPEVWKATTTARDGRVRCAQVQRLNPDKPATRILGHAETRTVCHAAWFGFGREASSAIIASLACDPCIGTGDMRLTMRRSLPLPRLCIAEGMLDMCIVAYRTRKGRQRTYRIGSMYRHVARYSPLGSSSCPRRSGQECRSSGRQDCRP